MWYFLVKQAELEGARYRQVQQQVALTEVEIFSEPYENWYVFSVEKDQYRAFMDYLDGQGIGYELLAERPTRSELLDKMR